MVLEAGETRRTIEFTVSEMDKLVTDMEVLVAGLRARSYRGTSVSRLKFGAQRKQVLTISVSFRRWLTNRTRCGEGLTTCGSALSDLGA